jgi:hypothetical protein
MEQRYRRPINLSWWRCNRMGAKSVLLVSAASNEGSVMKSGMQSGNARSELVFVLCLALAGLILVLVVAFAPWYGPVAVALGH